MQDQATGAKILKGTEQKLQELSSEFDKPESNCNGIKSDVRIKSNGTKSSTANRWHSY